MGITKIEDLIHYYELKAAKTRANLSAREQCGHGPWDRHELAKDLEFINALKSIHPYYLDGSSGIQNFIRVYFESLELTGGVTWTRDGARHI